MLSVDDLINDVILKEGSKYTNDPKDSGGPTKYGITQRTLSVALHHPASPEDVANLTELAAKAIYKNMYYYAPRIQELPEELQASVFDFGVNAGVGVAVRALQHVLELWGYECNQDGVVGPRTAKLATEAYTKYGAYLINSYAEYRCNFYTELATRRPKDQRFLKGWLARANSFRVQINE